MPGFWAVLFPDVSDLGESPEDVLPGDNVVGCEFAFAELGLEGREEGVVVVGCERGVEEAEVFRAEVRVLFLGLEGVEILLEGDASCSVAEVEFDALLYCFRAFGCTGVPVVKGSDLGECLVGPVLRGRAA